jgi:spore coat protein U-like protein
LPEKEDHPPLAVARLSLLIQHLPVQAQGVILTTDKCFSKMSLSGAVRLTLCFSLAAGLAPMADAAEATGQMTVKATVASSCVVGASNLDFGTPSSAAIQAGNIDATGTVIVNCTTGAAYTVALGAGMGAGATIAVRSMTSPATTTPPVPLSLLNYTIYADASRTTVWGTATGATVSGIGTGVNQTISAYGRIISPQTVRSGNYTDTVAVTVTY